MTESGSDRINEKIDDTVIAQLCSAARDAARHAYAPYSRFPVGAAALDDQGRVFAGCNIENASYGLTLCAERNAIAAAISAGARRLRALAVYTPTPSLTPPLRRLPPGDARIRPGHGHLSFQ